MIVIRFTSGLGNQMFQYNFYRLLKEYYKEVPVKADLTWFYANDDHHGYELQRIFGSVKDSPFFIEEVSKGELFKVTGLIPNLKQPSDMMTGAKGDGRASVDENAVKSAGRYGRYKRQSSECFEHFRRYPNRILREFTQKKRAPYVIDQLADGLHNPDDPGSENDLYEKVLNLDTSKDWYIKGFWIDEKYTIGREDFIHDHFRFPEISDGVNIKYANEIRNSNSVSIHVRRGDYLSDIYRDSFISLGRDYYEAAADHISGKIKDPVFFIFSDDPDFVRQEFSWLDNKRIVTGNDGEKAFRDMQLMSLCRHNIIANSTFSQWGALLNQNEGHITVYPKAYLKDEDNEVKNAAGWVRI